MLTVKDLEKKYNVCEATVYNWIIKGMPSIKLRSGSRRFIEEDVEDWMMGRKVKKRRKYYA